MSAQPIPQPEATPKWMVQAPDGKVIQFPDSFQESDVSREMAKMYPPPAPNMTGMPPLTSHTVAAGYALKEAAKGAMDAVKGIGQTLAPPSTTLEKFVNMLGPPAVPLMRMAQGIPGLLSQAAQVPGAIKDIANSPTGLANLASVAPRAGGEGAANLLPVILAEGISKLPNAARAGQAFQTAKAAAGDVPIDVTAPGNTALKIQQMAESGGSQPKVIRDFVRRTTDPAKGPMTYSEARDFYSNASRLSVDETNRLTPAMKRQVGQFTRDLGKSVQGAADQAGVGKEYSGAMKEYRGAMKMSEFTDTLKKGAVKAAKVSVPTAIGGGIAGYAVKKALE